MKTNKPGKQPTKGAKQILEENAGTLSFYQSMSFGTTVGCATTMSLFFPEDITPWYILINIFVVIIHFACYQLLKYMSKPTYTQNNQLSDPGLDLNIEGGMGENIKDIVILLSITQVMALLSNYFWFLLLLGPIRACWLLWANILGPWFFQQAPEDTEQDEKKRKKLERKMKRYQQ